ncbi:MAG TPA: hypothetical protein VFJ19_17760 [Nocardioidaceae bacterium]|nr:hypothetical protein [Nocardioidaceae bacterium]
MNLRRSRYRLAAASAVLLAAPLLSSCGVNFGAQTIQDYNPAAGVYDRSGAVDVVNALIVSGKKGSGTVVATLVNNDQLHADQLKKVTAGNPRTQDITGSLAGPTKIPAGGVLDLASTGGATVKGPTIKPGAFIPLTFKFAHAKSIVLDVPVFPHSDPVYKHVPLPQS